MIGIGARWIEIGILRRSDPETARHVHEIGDADLRARIVPALPLRNRSRLVQIIDALLYENAQECGRQALSHRPAFQGRARRDTGAVSLADDPSLPRHHKAGSHPRGRLEGRVHGRPDRGRVELMRSEEHTSELQSLAYLVCRLLLEKKKKIKNRA